MNKRNDLHQRILNFRNAREWAQFHDPKNLIIEVTCEHKKDKAVKVSTAKPLWIPAINHHGFSRWTFIEIPDPWNAKNEIRAALQSV